MGLGKVDKDSASSSPTSTLGYIYDGSAWIPLKGDADGKVLVNEVEYIYHGKKTNDGYTYYAFKQHGGSKYRIMKKSDTDGSLVSWATGATNFAADWAVYLTLTYTVAPNT